MSAKSPIKNIVDSFIEQSIESSSQVKKLITSVTLIAMESKKIAEAILVLSKRLDEHEELILKIVELQRGNSVKDPVDSIEFIKSKEKSSKPN